MRLRCVYDAQIVHYRPIIELSKIHHRPITGPSQAHPYCSLRVQSPIQHRYATYFTPVRRPLNPNRLKPIRRLSPIYLTPLRMICSGQKNCPAASFASDSHGPDSFNSFLRPAVDDLLRLERGVMAICADGQTKNSEHALHSSKEICHQLQMHWHVDFKMR